MTPDRTPFLTYAFHEIGGVVVAILFICAIGWVWHRYVEARIRRHVSQALDNGDARTLRAVVEMDAYRSRVAVPRKLTERSR